MLGVLHGFALILGLIGAGYLTALFGVVKGDQRLVLNNVAFFVATPALLFGVLHDSDPSVLFTPVIIITTLAAIIAAVVYVIASRLWFKRSLAETTLGATCAGYVNSNNLGLPVAVYILGDAAYVAPLLLVQLVLFSPAILAILESTRGPGRSGLKGAWVALGRAASNPIIIASIGGFLFAAFGIQMPDLVLAPIEMLGAAAIPMVLLSFGISLYGQRALQRGTGRLAVFTSSGIKLILMPVVAWALSIALGLGPHETLVATTIAALPTAQNVYNYAATYRQGEVMVRDTVFFTTFVSLPVIALVAWLLG